MIFENASRPSRTLREAILTPTREPGEMRTILERLAANGGGLEACDITEFIALAGLEEGDVAPSVLAYFQSLPAEDAELGPFMILAPESVYQEARQLLPSCGVVVHGFLTFAREAAGDVLVVRLTTGEVLLLNHDIYLSEEWIEPRYDPDLTQSRLEEHLPVNEQNILATAAGKFVNLEAFFSALS